mgnify:CR=1 FL=1
MKTKHYSIILLILLIVSACAPIKYSKGTKYADKKELKAFLKGLKEVALSKHYTLLMDYMDEGYIEHAHEIESNGDDLLFVDEIFTGYDVDTKTYHCIHQKDIISFETVQVTQIKPNLYTANFVIGDTHSTIDCKLLIKKSIQSGQIKFGLLEE